MRISIHSLLTLLMALAACQLAAQDSKPPNVVIVYTDDQGYADVGCFGAEGFETPNLDRMAAEGTRFTDFHVAQPVCSASRAALLTGCYPNRIGIHGALGPRARHGIHENEMTIAELLKQKGYATAIFGKWHLGHHEKFLPTNHGFDEYYGIPYSNDMWPFHPTASFPDLPLIEGTEIINKAMQPADQKTLTKELTERAVDFINRNKNNSFFLYLPHPQPHVPLFASDDFEGTTERGLYGDVISEIDWSVGQILEALKENGVDENTLVIYASDNGPWLSYGTHGGSAKPLREGKGTNWEGGTRVPCIMRFPGRIPAGEVNDTMLMTIDILPTIAEITGTELPDHKIDGENVWPILAGEEAEHPHDAYFFYFKNNHLEAVRSGAWKLVLPHGYRTMDGRPGGTDGTPKPYSHKRVGMELYNVDEDISETKNVIEEEPEVLKRMLGHVEQARSDLGDRLSERKATGARAPGRL